MGDYGLLANLPNDFYDYVQKDNSPIEDKLRLYHLRKARNEKNSEVLERDLLIKNYLQNTNLFNLITDEEFNNIGIKGEQKSRKAIFLSLCSVWVEGSDIPLNTLVSSESSAGKSFLCKKIIRLFPKEMVQYRTKITPEAFTYWHHKEEDWNWDGKICYLEDINQAILDAPTFKVMCSEGSMATIVVKQKAYDIEIQGKPVMLVTTARTNPNAEILNRFQIISLDESDKQTEDIVFQEAKRSEGKSKVEYNSDITSALRLLKRNKVNIPYATKIAEYLKKEYNFKSLRLRRDFSRLLDLIRCSAVLYQYQRTKEQDTIIANEEDYRIARECINYIQTATFKGLTHRLKKAFDCCNELKEFTAPMIHSKFPFVNQKSWYNYLDELLERKMLKTEIRKIEGVKSDGKKFVTNVTYYQTLENSTFELPEFQLLPDNITIATIDTNDTNDTNDTKGNTDCNDYTDYSKKAQNNEIDFSKTGIKEGLEDE